MSATFKHLKLNRILKYHKLILKEFSKIYLPLCNKKKFLHTNLELDQNESIL
jgi:hypothetical protein